MKNVRIFYTKTGRMKFVSHLDMNRFMTRIIQKSGIPIWYTEGFHPHPYITFALPLSLGFESEYEVMDLRLEDDEYSLDMLCERLSAACPPYINILSAAEPVTKPGKIGFSKFRVVFDGADEDFKAALETFLNSESVIARKTTKRGAIKEIDLIPAIKSSSVIKNSDSVTLEILLPAGSADNINPTLLIDAFFEQTGIQPLYYAVIREQILDENMALFV